MTKFLQKIFALVFTALFFSLSAALIVSIFVVLIKGVMAGEEMTQLIIQSVNTGIIAIAVFELATVIDKEYGNTEEHDVIVMLRRTLPRFIGTVCVALSLEGLIMVIKYSQLNLASNLYYPVAIICSASFLLIALGLFLKLTPVSLSSDE